MKIDIIVPVYNEEKFVGKFLDNLLAEIKTLSSVRNIIIVDDGSTDNTRKIIDGKKSDKIIRIDHDINKGKGAAMRAGFSMAKKNKPDAVIYMDGDMQHDPKHLKDFIEALRDNTLVFGYRKLGNDVQYIRRLGNDIVRYLFRSYFNIKRYDILCGFMALRKEMFDDLTWHSDNYGVEPEISAIVGKKRLPFKEILIDTIYLKGNEGLTLLDAFFISLKIPFWYFQY